MNREYMNAFSDAFLSVMPQLGIEDIKQTGERACGKKIDPSEVVCIVGVIGDLAGNVIFAMTEDTAENTASAMMGGMEVEEFDELTQSAISELSNMLAANACIGLSEKGMTVDISTPTLMHGVFTVSGSYDEGVCFEMAVGEMPFNIFVSLEKRR